MAALQNHLHLGGVIPTFNHIQESDVAGLYVGLHSEFPEWIVIPIKAWRLVGLNRDIWQGIVCIHYWIFTF